MYMYIIYIHVYQYYKCVNLVIVEYYGFFFQKNLQGGGGGGGGGVGKGGLRTSHH